MVSELLDFSQSKRLIITQIACCFTVMVNMFGLAETKSCWQKVRNQSFWELDCQLNSDAFFKSNFRMSRKSFKKLCGLLQNLEKMNTNYRNAISLEQRVAIALYALGSAAEYRTIANLFGVGKSTVGAILIQFCNECWTCLWPLYLKNFPLTENKIQEYTNGFEYLGFPQVIGAIDGCHIEIHPAAEDAIEYYNYKGWYSMVLLAVVDARYRFAYINIGSPGRVNDSAIYEQSRLKRALSQCSLLRQMEKEICGVNVPVMILGDSAFKFSEYIMKPYPFRINQPSREKGFNYNLSKCRRVVENAFGHLKGRFRRIGKGVDNHIKNSTKIIKACCVLHNFLNEENDKINAKWLEAQQAEDNERQFPESTPDRTGNTNNEAEKIRNALACYFESARVVDAEESFAPGLSIDAE